MKQSGMDDCFLSLQTDLYLIRLRIEYASYQNKNKLCSYQKNAIEPDYQKHSIRLNGVSDSSVVVSSFFFFDLLDLRFKMGILQEKSRKWESLFLNACFLVCVSHAVWLAACLF